MGVGAIECPEMMDSLAEWVWAVQVVTTTVVASVVAYIAFQQWKTNQNRLRYELFDRRLKHCEAAKDFIISVWQNATASDEALQEFYRGIQGAVFIFDADTAEYLKSLHKQGLELRATIDEMEGLEQETRRSEFVAKKWKIIKWFDGELSQLEIRFGKFLNIR